MLYMFDDVLNNKIITEINNIINIKHDYWNKLSKNIKIRYLRYFCNILEKNDKDVQLFSIKPNKLIKIFGFNKKNGFVEYWKSMLDYTFTFRENYVKTKLYYNYKTMPVVEYNKLLNDINGIIYLFLNNNKDNINKNVFCDNISKKCMVDRIDTINFDMCNNLIYIFINDNVKIKLVPYLYNDKITNNIPIKYKIVQIV